jgi:hypothetical protein
MSTEFNLTPFDENSGKPKDEWYAELRTELSDKTKAILAGIKDALLNGSPSELQRIPKYFKGLVQLFQDLVDIKSEEILIGNDSLEAAKKDIAELSRRLEVANESISTLTQRAAALAAEKTELQSGKETAISASRARKAREQEIAEAAARAKAEQTARERAALQASLDELNDLGLTSYNYILEDKVFKDKRGTNVDASKVSPNAVIRLPDKSEKKKSELDVSLYSGGSRRRQRRRRRQTRR